MNNKITILLADDHPLIRRALKDVLEEQEDFQVVGEAKDGEEAINQAVKLMPDVIIMDISMPKINGLEATRQIKLKLPDVLILVLTIHGESEHVLSILEAGALGYLTKRALSEEVVQAVRSVIAGETVLDTSITQQLIKNARKFMPQPISLELGEKLTGRELEILQWAARGFSNKDISIKLNISVPTVKSHLADIYAKLKVKSRIEAVILGLRKGFLIVDNT